MATQANVTQLPASQTILSIFVISVRIDSEIVIILVNNNEAVACCLIRANK